MSSVLKHALAVSYFVCIKQSNRSTRMNFWIGNGNYRYRWKAFDVGCIPFMSKTYPGPWTILKVNPVGMLVN